MNTPTYKRAKRGLGLTWIVITSCLAGFAHAQQIGSSSSLPALPLDTACFATLNRPTQDADAVQACNAALADAAVDLSPAKALRQARLYSALAMLAAQRNELAAARDNMNRALSLSAEDNIVQGNHGSLLLREGAYRDAVETYNVVLTRLLEQAPDSPLQAPLYLNRSLALRALGRYDEASKDYQLYLIMTGAEPPPGSELPAPVTDAD